MEYVTIGDVLGYEKYNAIVYLLRKFKRLTSDLRIASEIKSDYGSYSFSDGLTSVGGNYILEDDVTITSSDVLLNCFYTFHFTVVDVNLSGTVNRRVVSVTGDTGDDGELSVTLPSDSLESDEQILPDFKVDIVFDEHEYYTPIAGLNIDLSVDKLYVDVGDTATVTAVFTTENGTPMQGLTTSFDVNGAVTTKVTDENGEATITYTGVGGVGWVTVKVGSDSVKFYDGEVTTAEYTGDSITLGYSNKWLDTVGEAIIDWGDGTTSTVNNPTNSLTHNYTDSESNHEIVFIGEVTKIGDFCFESCTGLTSIVVPNSVTSLGTACFRGCTGLTSVTMADSITRLEYNCFYGCAGLTSVVIPDYVTTLGEGCFQECTGLTSVTIPNSVVSIGGTCFWNCGALIDYQLYWEIPPKTWSSYDMPYNTNTLFIIPVGETSNYISKGYPSTKIVERGDTLTITADKPIIQSTETSTITAQLKHDGRIATGKTLSYEIKHGSTTIDSGLDTTDSNGEIDITYTGTGIGEVDIIITYDTLEETYEILDAIAYDKGTITEHSDIWTGNTSDLTRQSDSSLFSSTASRYIDNDTLITGDFEATFEAMATNAPMWGVVDETKTYRTRAYFRNDATFVYYKLTRQNGVITFKYSSDGTNWSNISAQASEFTTEDCYFRFHNNNGIKSITFKNLLIYPI